MPYFCTRSYILNNQPRSQHRLDIIRDLERRLRLRLDLIHSNAIRQLDQGQAVCEVDVEDTLVNTHTSIISITFREAEGKSHSL